MYLRNLELEGFKFKDDISSDEFENAVALVKEHSVTSEVVKEEIDKLFVEMKKSQGYYEGWSTTLVKEVDIC